MAKVTENQVAAGLKAVVDKWVPNQGEMAKVMEVDKTLMTCKVKIISDDLELSGVQLKATSQANDSNGFVLIPKKDSIVLISMMEDFKYSYYISMYSDIDEIQLVQNDEEILKIDNTGNVSFHKGENKGLIKIDSLVEKLNALEKKVNDLITDYKGHNHAHPQGPTTAFLVPSTLTSLTETQVADLENDKVKH